MRVALWGFYAYGHFGDDLVAGILGSYLRETCEAEVVVYRLCAPYAQRFGLPVAATTEELVEGADVLVFGGSSILESSPPPRQGFGTAAKLPGHSADSERILELTRAHEVPIAGISIGGDGIYPRLLYPPSKQEFLDRADYISVRYEDDLRLLREHDKRGDCFPDLLWHTPRLFPAAAKDGAPLRVGVNLYVGQIVPQRAFWVPPLIYAAALRHRSVEWLFLDTANRSRNPFRALPRIPGVRGANYMFEHPDADLATIASLNLLITTQTPLAVVAMSYGVPTLIVAPDLRSRRLLRDIGASQHGIGGADAARLWQIFRNRDQLTAFLDAYQLPSLPDLQERSAGHLQKLGAIVEMSGRDSVTEQPSSPSGRGLR